MKVNPKSLTNRDELNLRQGIKSSLPKMKQLIATVYTIFKICDTSSLDYSEEYDNQGNKAIRLVDKLNRPLSDFFQDQLSSSSLSERDFLSKFNESPLFIAQLEPLQVAIQLFWKLGEINFASRMATSTERTGGNRYNKTLTFSTKLDIVDNVLTDKKGNLEDNTKNLLFNYITDFDLITNNIEKKLIKILTVFSEDAQYKIRLNNNQELYFQLEGIYSEILNNNMVENKDTHEEVGPFRVLKSAVSSNLNYFIDPNDTDGFKLKNDVNDNELHNYLTRVNSYLNLNPQKTSNNIIEEPFTEEPTTEYKIPFTSTNKIFYGAPGTGKSYKVYELTKGKEDRTERVTFHPEYDYSSFVGGYKPTMDGDDIKYEFVPQAFINIYVMAWNDLDNDYYLVIEEINRGNCAEIFGDIFQLLDRSNEYKVTPSKELKEHLNAKFKDNDDIDGEKLLLPPNLNILATMNTSDQSLFPMDSAFKRRWDWEYIPIDYDTSESNISSKYKVQLTESEYFSWLDFIESVNTKIKSNNSLGMDKCIGNYFIKPKFNIIDIDTFINKAIYYLWNDVFKDEFEDDNIFKDSTTYEDFFPIHTNGLNEVRGILEVLEVKIIDS